MVLPMKRMLVRMILYSGRITTAMAIVTKSRVPTMPQDDTDSDGYCDDDDACVDDPLQWTDADGDGYCEVDDACPNDPLQWTDTTATAAVTR